jgi:excisionase family DNA binding protein
MTGLETYLDVEQVAEMLGLSIATIRKWVLIGYIPYLKIGRVIRFSASEVQDWARGKNSVSTWLCVKGHEGGGK